MIAAIGLASERRLPPPWLAMAGKELRENFKWAVLGLIAVALALAYAVLSAKPQTPTDWTVIEYWGNVNKALAGTAPLLGILLALLQTIPEKRRDLWAFLIHRPASRASIFLGKAVAGLGLYITAMTLPFLGVILWAAGPGNIPGPFVWELTLAGWAAILAGIVFYFATLLTVLRPGRWYGRKMLPIVAVLPILLLLAVGTPFSFPLSAGIMLLYAAVFAAAACKAFQTDGEFQDGISVGRISLSLILFTASAVVLLLAALLGASIKGIIARGSGHEYTSQDYGLRQSGEVVRITYHDSDTTYTGVRTPEGRPENRPLDREAMADGYYTTDPFAINPPDDIRNSGFTTPQQIVQQAQNITSTNLFWYYVPALGQFVAYSPITQRFDSAIGPNGWNSDRSNVTVANPGHFPDRIWNTTTSSDTIFCTETDAYEIGRASNPAWRIPLPAGIGKIIGVTDLTNVSLMNRTSPFPDMLIKDSFPAIVIATARSFTLISRGGDVLGSIPREFDVQAYPRVSVIWPMFANSTDSPHTKAKRNRVYIWYQSDNDIQVRTWSINGKKIGAYTAMSTIDNIDTADAPTTLLLPAAVPTIMWMWNTSQHTHSMRWKIGLSAFSAEASERLHYAIITLCCPLLAFLISWRCRLPVKTRVAWTLALVLLGIPGVLTMLALYTWPTLVRCPNCSRKRTVDAENCSHCKSPFPSPALTGTEIFDDATTSLTVNSSGLGSKWEVVA